MKKFIVFHSHNERVFSQSMILSFQMEDSDETPTIRVRDGYKPIAEISVEVEPDEVGKEASIRMLEDVYRRTNHIDSSWYDGPGVRIIDDITWAQVEQPDGSVKKMRRIRSTSVGDFVLDADTGEAFMVAGCGFRAVKLEI